MSQSSDSPTTKASAASKQEPTLEQAVERLEKIVETLESGDADLEKSIDLYLEGKRLGQVALRKLEVLERRIQVVTGENPDGSLQTKDFQEEGG